MVRECAATHTHPSGPADAHHTGVAGHFMVTKVFVYLSYTQYSR